MNVTELRVHEPAAVEVASAYLELPARRSPVLEAAYARLVAESDRIFTTVTSANRPGAIRVRFSTCAHPYDSAEDLITSVREDRFLEVTGATVDRDRRHPVLDGSLGGAFDRFRAVHDILGHGYPALVFDRHGEFAAWRFQERFHSRLARRALATELHAKHSVCWTTGESPEHKAVLIPAGLLTRSRQASCASAGDWGVPRTQADRSGATVPATPT